MHTIEIRPELHCRLDRVSEKPPVYRLPCITRLIEVEKFLIIIDSILLGAPRLSRLTIRAPKGLSGMDDEYLIPEPRSSDIGPSRNVAFRRDSSGIQDHGHVIDAPSLSHLVSEMVRRGLIMVPHLQELRVLGFANTEWQSLLASAEMTLCELALQPSAYNLTTIDLQLEMSTRGPNNCLSSLVEVTKRTIKLKVLRIRSGPKALSQYRIPTEYWAPLLKQLGERKPPFKLHTLDLDGLATSKVAPTLDRIVAAHSCSLRRLVLGHTNFHYPNTLYAFFSALAKSDVSYFELSWLFLHHKSLLVASSLSFAQVPDEVLKMGVKDLRSDCDMSNYDWIVIRWDVDRHDAAVVYDNEDGFYGQDWIKRCCQNALTSIECGAIDDS